MALQLPLVTAFSPMPTTGQSLVDPFPLGMASQVASVAKPVSLILKLPPGTLWVFGIVLIIHFLFCWETQWIWDFIKYPHRKQLDCTLPYLSQGWAQSLTGGSASHSLSTDDSLSEIFPVTPSPAPGMLPSASQLWAQSHGSKNYEH